VILLKPSDEFIKGFRTIKTFTLFNNQEGSGTNNFKDYFGVLRCR